WQCGSGPTTASSRARSASRPARRRGWGEGRGPRPRGPRRPRGRSPPLAPRRARGTLAELPCRGVAVGDLERLVDRFYAERELVLSDDEWRRDEQHVPATEDVDVALHQRGTQRAGERLCRPVPALEHLFRAAVLDQLDGGEQAAAADVPDGGVPLGELPQLGEELLAHARAAVDDPVVAIRCEARSPGGAGERMPGVGRADPQDVVVEVLRDLLAHDRAAERDVARGHALRERHHVGYHALVVGTEPPAGPAEAGHHLVEHQEDPVLVAEPPQA